MGVTASIAVLESGSSELIRIGCMTFAASSQSPLARSAGKSCGSSAHRLHRRLVRGKGGLGDWPPDRGELGRPVIRNRAPFHRLRRGPPLAILRDLLT